MLYPGPSTPMMQQGSGQENSAQGKKLGEEGYKAPIS
jgi:hypothetical protein